MVAIGEVGWIDQDCIVDWWDRQPDTEDPTAGERMRNMRARRKAQEIGGQELSTGTTRYA